MDGIPIGTLSPDYPPTPSRAVVVDVTSVQPPQKAESKEVSRWLIVAIVYVAFGLLALKGYYWPLVILLAKEVLDLAWLGIYLLVRGCILLLRALVREVSA